MSKKNTKSRFCYFCCCCCMFNIFPELYDQVKDFIYSILDYMSSQCLPLSTKIANSKTVFCQFKVVRDKNSHDFVYSGKVNAAETCERLILVQGANELQVFNFLAKKSSISRSQRSVGKNNELFFFQQAKIGVTMTRDRKEDIYKEWLHFNGANIIVFAPIENNISNVVTQFKDELVRRKSLDSTVNAAVIVYPDSSFEEIFNKKPDNEVVEMDNNCVFVSISMDYLKRSNPDRICSLVEKQLKYFDFSLGEKRGDSFDSQLRYGLKNVFNAAIASKESNNIQVTSFNKHSNSGFGYSIPASAKFKFRQELLFESGIKLKKEKLGIIDSKQIVPLEAVKIETEEDIVFATILPIGFAIDEKQIKIENSSETVVMKNRNYFKVNCLLERKQTVEAKVINKYSTQFCTYDFSNLAQYYQFSFYLPSGLDYTDYIPRFEKTSDEITKLMIIYEKPKPKTNGASLVEVEDDGEEVSFD